jgi:hypothetical protein
MLVSQSAVTFRNNKGETRTFDLSEYDGLFLDKRLLYEGMDEMEKSLAFVLYPFAVLFFFLFRLIEVVIFAATASFFARSDSLRLNYRAYMRLAAVSLTPMMVLGAILNTAGIALPFWWLTSIPLTAGYLFFAVRVNREVK